VTARLPIGQLLVQAGHVDVWQLQSALAHQRCWGGRIGEALVRLGFLTEPVLLAEVARQHGVPHVEIGERIVAPAIVRLVPEKLIRARKVFPIAYASQPRRGLLVVATSKPQDLTVLDEVAFASGKTVNAALASDRDIERAIERHFGGLDVMMRSSGGEHARPALVPMRAAAYPPRAA
jgi:type IV pilus assembly protein PilB